MALVERYGHLPIVLISVLSTSNCLIKQEVPVYKGPGLAILTFTWQPVVYPALTTDNGLILGRVLFSDFFFSSGPEGGAGSPSPFFIISNTLN